MGKDTGYWYLRDRELFDFEMEGFEKFKQEYGYQGFKYKIGSDQNGKICIHVVMPYLQHKKINPKQEWKQAEFLIKYEHNHPSKDAEGYFGTSIFVYPLHKCSSGFHHQITGENGKKAVCQVRDTEVEKVTSYYVLKRLLRWLCIYDYWVATGIDLDK